MVFKGHQDFPKTQNFKKSGSTFLKLGLFGSTEVNAIKFHKRIS